MLRTTIVSRVDISPLTTTFTAPSSCASEFTVISSGSRDRVTLVPYVEIPDQPLNYTNFQQVATCYPPTFQYFPNYSPGFLCPSGFTTAFRFNKYFNTVTGPEDTFTYAECCPSDYPFDSNSKKCIRSFTSTEVFSVSGTETHFTTLGEGVAFAPSIELYWKQADLDEYHTTLAIPTHTFGPGISGPTSEGQSSPAPTNSPTKSGSSEGSSSTSMPSTTSSSSAGASLARPGWRMVIIIGITTLVIALGSQ